MAVSLQKICFLVAFATGVGAVAAQSPPAPLPALMEKGDNNSGSVTQIDSLNQEQRKIFEKDTVRKAGYFEVAVSSKFLDVVHELKKKINLPATIPASILQIAIDNKEQYKFIGQFSESANKSNVFYERTDGSLIMFTAWNFSKDGSRLFVVKEFQNVSVNGRTGNLTLVKSDNSAKAFWKLTWITLGDQLQIEMWVEDRLDNKRQPMLRSDSVHALALSFCSSC